MAEQQLAVEDLPWSTGTSLSGPATCGDPHCSRGNSEEKGELHVWLQPRPLLPALTVKGLGVTLGGNHRGRTGAGSEVNPWKAGRKVVFHVWINIFLFLPNTWISNEILLFTTKLISLSLFCPQWCLVSDLLPPVFASAHKFSRSWSSKPAEGGVSSW